MNEMKTITPPLLEDKDLAKLADNIAHLVSDAKSHLVQTVNTTLVQTNWNIGRYIVEFEQKGNAKAKYGIELLTSLAKLLRIKLGKGYSRPNLNNMRKFYLLYPICQTLSDKLSWSHICELTTIDDDLERSFYEKECVAENWGVRSLRRQMDSALYLRLAASKDKEGIMQLAQEGLVVQQIEYVIKQTYTLEFLGIPERKRYSGKDLEQRLIDNLQTFVLGHNKDELMVEYATYGMDSNLFVSKYELYCQIRRN